jgi:hypothetical protein
MECRIVLGLGGIKVRLLAYLGNLRLDMKRRLNKNYWDFLNKLDNFEKLIDYKKCKHEDNI